MRHIYITTCDINGGIYHYILNDGRLDLKEKLPVDRAMYTVLNGTCFYTLARDLGNDDRFGGVAKGYIDKEGKMHSLSNFASSKGIVPCHLCVENEEIYVVNYLSGNVVKIPENIVTHKGNGVNPVRQDSPHTHFVTLSPDKKFVLVTDLGLDTIFVYDRELNLVSFAKVPDGSGCRHLVFSKNGKYVYCVNELSNDVSVFVFNNGSLTLLNTYFAIPDFKEKSTAAAIRLKGDYLYISHRGANCITTYRINGKKLEFLANSPCGGNAPRDFNIAEDYIICANEGGSVTLMKLEDGIPEFTASYPLDGDPLGVEVGFV